MSNNDSGCVVAHRSQVVKLPKPPELPGTGMPVPAPDRQSLDRQSPVASAHLLHLNVQLIKRLLVHRPRLPRVVGDKDQFLALCAQQRQNLAHALDDDGAVVDHAIAVEEERVGRVDELEVVFGSGQDGRDHGGRGLRRVTEGSGDGYMYGIVDKERLGGFD